MGSFAVPAKNNISLWCILPILVYFMLFFKTFLCIFYLKSGLWLSRENIFVTKSPQVFFQRFRFKRPRFRLRRNSKGFPRKLSRRTFVCKWQRFVHFCSTQKRNECTDVTDDNFSASLTKRICFSRFFKSSRKRQHLFNSLN